ncbi:MAG: carbon monoxide dehydrogenase [Streptosporangiales bacterium]|nr:carbon monoxide dehydrogenase [Streptosporangiales bacterium]
MRPTSTCRSTSVDQNASARSERLLPRFAVERPRSLTDALDLLQRFGDDAAFYMGGTELLLLMKLGMADASLLVDGKRLPELRRLDSTDGILRIGAGETHRDIERSPVVRTAMPALAALARGVANLRVRNAGTLGGNLCFAEPHSDPATLLIALGAEVRLASTGGERTVALEDFILGALTTALADGEVMTEVHVPIPRHDVAVAYERVKFRERPVVNVAVVHDAHAPRVVVGAVGNHPCRVPEAEARLAADPSDTDAVAAAAGAAANPVADADGSDDYKRHLVYVATKRACTAAGVT